MNSNARVNVIDALKGVGIILVVIGHALGGLIDAGLIPSTDWFRPLFASIYMFHMPLFFFISGIFVSKRLTSDPKKFKYGLITKIAYPYFLWSFIQVTIIYLASSLVNHPIESLSYDYAKIFFHPPSQFWFLFALFLMHYVALLLKDFLKTPFFLLVALCLYSMSEFGLLPYILNMSSKMILYYALGVYFGEYTLQHLNAGTVDRAWFLSVSLAILFGSISYFHAINLDGNSSWPNQAASIFNAVNGFHNFFAASMAVIALFFVWLKFPKLSKPWLVYLGQASMPIYILHIIFLAGFRIIILKIYPGLKPEFLLVVLTFIGLLMPVLVFEVSKKLRLSALLGFK